MAGNEAVLEEAVLREAVDTTSVPNPGAAAPNPLLSRAAAGVRTAMAQRETFDRAQYLPPRAQPLAAPSAPLPGEGGGFWASVQAALSDGPDALAHWQASRMRSLLRR